MFGSFSMLDYNNSGDLTHIVAHEGGVTPPTYSSTLHRLRTVTDTVGRTESTTFDSLGNMLTNVDGAGYTRGDRTTKLDGYRLLRLRLG